MPSVSDYLSGKDILDYKFAGIIIDTFADLRQYHPV